MAEAAVADKVPKRRIAPATIALVLAGLIALGAIIYSTTRSGGSAAAEAVGGNAAAEKAPPEQVTPAQSIDTMMAELARNPDNDRGWFTVGIALKAEGRFAEAQQAFRRAAQLKPNDADYLSSLAEMLLVIGGGEGEREAETLLRRALAINADHPAPRYYLATLKDRKGQHREAIDDLLALLNDAPPGAPWERQVREAAQRIAQARNIDIAGRLPAPRPAPPATQDMSGPTSEQMEAARGVPASQQEEMVKAMVDRLYARLRQNPRDERGWMMLMRSRMVQREPQAAAAALRSALSAFSDDAAAQQRLRAAAGDLGIPQG